MNKTNNVIVRLALYQHIDMQMIFQFKASSSWLTVCKSFLHDTSKLDYLYLYLCFYSFYCFEICKQFFMLLHVNSSTSINVPP